MLPFLSELAFTYILLQGNTQHSISFSVSCHTLTGPQNRGRQSLSGRGAQGGEDAGDAGEDAGDDGGAGEDAKEDCLPGGQCHGTRAYAAI